MNPSYAILPPIAMMTIGFCNPVDGHAEDVAARRELRAAITAIGGERVLPSVHALELHAIGHRNMLEQSSGWSGDRFAWTDTAAARGVTDRFMFQRNGPGMYQASHAVAHDGKIRSTVDTSLCRRQ